MPRRRRMGGARGNPGFVQRRRDERFRRADESEAEDKDKDMRRSESEQKDKDKPMMVPGGG